MSEDQKHEDQTSAVETDTQQLEKLAKRVDWQEKTYGERTDQKPSEYNPLHRTGRDRGDNGRGGR